jgi:hypothetical protein
MISQLEINAKAAVTRLKNLMARARTEKLSKQDESTLKNLKAKAKKSKARELCEV